MCASDVHAGNLIPSRRRWSTRASLANTARAGATSASRWTWRRRIANSCRCLDRNNSDEVSEPSKVFRVARIHRQVFSAGGCCYQQIQRPRTARLASSGNLCSVDSPVGAGGFSVEGEGVKDGFCPLEAVLATCPLLGVLRRMWAGGELGHGDCAHRQFDRKLVRVELFEVDDHGSVDEPTLVAW